MSVDLRVRAEPLVTRRFTSTINFDDDAVDGWLVLASDGDHVLEMRMLPGEYAFETEQRFRASMGERYPGDKPLALSILRARLDRSSALDLPVFKPSQVALVRIVCEAPR